MDLNKEYYRNDDKKNFLAQDPHKEVIAMAKIYFPAVTKFLKAPEGEEIQEVKKETKLYLPYNFEIFPSSLCCAAI